MGLRRSRAGRGSEQGVLRRCFSPKSGSSAGLRINLIVILVALYNFGSKPSMSRVKCSPGCLPLQCFATGVSAFGVMLAVRDLLTPWASSMEDRRRTEGLPGGRGGSRRCDATATFSTLSVRWCPSSISWQENGSKWRRMRPPVVNSAMARWTRLICRYVRTGSRGVAWRGRTGGRARWFCGRAGAQSAAQPSRPCSTRMCTREGGQEELRLQFFCAQLTLNSGAGDTVFLKIFARLPVTYLEVFRRYQIWK